MAVAGKAADRGIRARRRRGQRELCVHRTGIPNDGKASRPSGPAWLVRSTKMTARLEASRLPDGIAAVVSAQLMASILTSPQTTRTV